MLGLCNGTLKRTTLYCFGRNVIFDDIGKYSWAVDSRPRKFGVLVPRPRVIMCFLKEFLKILQSYRKRVNPSCKFSFPLEKPDFRLINCVLRLTLKAIISRNDCTRTNLYCARFLFYVHWWRKKFKKQFRVQTAALQIKQRWGRKKFEMELVS